MKILVTGTAGFIGFHLAKQLIQRGYHVYGLDNINSYYEIRLKYGRLAETGIEENVVSYGQLIASSRYPNYHFIQLSLEDREPVAAFFQQQRFDVVINLAAQAGVRYSLQNPHAYTDSNLTGFINILEGCRHTQVKHLVYASSSSVYGLNGSMPLSVHDPTEHPISLYAATKKANEMMAHSYSHLYRLPVTGLRFFTVYGPWGRPDMAFFLFTKAILKGEQINVYNNGEMIRDFTYVDDIVEGVIRVALKPATANAEWSPLAPDIASSSAPYRLANIGNAEPVKLLDFINAIEDALGMKANINFMPIQPGDVPATFADMTEMRVNYQYEATTHYRDGIQKFVDWYKDIYLGKIVSADALL